MLREAFLSQLDPFTTGYGIARAQKVHVREPMSSADLAVVECRRCGAAPHH